VAALYESSDRADSSLRRARCASGRRSRAAAGRFTGAGARKAASVNPVDFKIRNGQYPAVKEDRLPYTLGRDVSGVVEKCGAQATLFKIGDEVLGMVGIGGGGYAEKVVLDQRAITHKPAPVDYSHLSLIVSGPNLRGPYRSMPSASTPAKSGACSHAPSLARPFSGVIFG